MNTNTVCLALALGLSAFSVGAADAPAPAPTTAASAPAPAAPPAAGLPNGGQRKPCEELKTEIAGRMDAKGVQNYTLRIVTNDEAAAATDEKVVGSCDGGTMKILYKRG